MSGSPIVRSRAMRHGVVALQLAVIALGLAFMLVGLFAGLQTSTALTLLGIGAVLVFIGVGDALAVAVAPLAALIGRPLAATGGVAGRIARGNAVRSPTRTAGTAAALMVGVALVAFVAIFVNGFKASFSGAFEKTVTADFVVIDRSGLTPEAVAPAAARLDGVGAAANLRVGRGKLPSGADVGLSGLDPRLASQVIKLEWVEGRARTAGARLRRGDARGGLGEGALPARRVDLRGAQRATGACAPDRPRDLRGPRPDLPRRGRPGHDPPGALRRPHGARGPHRCSARDIGRPGPR